MALVAMMVAQEVTGRHSTVWEECDEDDVGALLPAEAFNNYVYGVPFWLRDAAFVRQGAGKGQESFKLTCVRSHDDDDPNGEFFTASPNGELSMSVENPGAMGYIEPGAKYRITIEKVRGPRR